MMQRMQNPPSKSRQALCASASEERFTPTSRIIATLLLGAGMALRLWFFFRYSRISGDGLLYGNLAQNLLQHHVYGFSEGALVRSTLIRLPGYPLFLAACFRIFGMDRYPAVLLVQIAIDLATVMLCALLARRWFGLRAGLAALALGALCPFTANYTAAPLTETLVLFTIALAFYALDRWQACLTDEPRLPASGTHAWRSRWLFVLAFALAYSLLLRPDQALLAAAIVPVVWWISTGGGASRLKLRTLRPALVLSLLILLPLVPWTLRNWHVFHVIQPLAPRYANDPGEPNPYGFQRWYRTWAIDFASTEQVYWAYDSDPLNIADMPNRAFDTQTQYDTTAALIDDYNIDTSSTPELDARFAALAAQRIAAEPMRYTIALPVARLCNMLFRPRLALLPVPLEWWKPRNHPAATAFAWFWATLNLAYFALAVWTLGHRSRWAAHQPFVLAMAAYILLRCALLLTLDNSEPRYTLEFFPILFILGSAVFQRRQQHEACRHSRNRICD
jgi:4-amino-4-deoxy-L-arabinose transferase-like glycosyltransferase